MPSEQTGTGPDPARSTLELLYNISREIASDLDLQTVLRRVLMRSLESVGGISGSIIVMDENGLPVDSIIIHTGRVYAQTTGQLSSLLEKGLAGWVSRHRETVIIPDTSRDERWEKRPDDAPDQTGPKSALGAPLLARDALVGVMTLVHPQPGTFSEEHGALMRAIADLAGITVLNARLYEESRRQARVMTALTESAMAMTASLETGAILQRVLEQVQKALDAEAVSLALVNPDRRTLTLQAATRAFPRAESEGVFRLGQGIAGRVAESGETLLIADTAGDDRFDPQIDQLPGIWTTAVGCAPIHFGGEVIGVLEAINPAGGFEPGDKAVLEGIGSLAGSVIRHAQLYERLEAALRSYRELFDDSIDLILITDWGGRIRQLNRRAGEAVHLETDGETSIFDLHRPNQDEVEPAFFTRLANLETVSYESELHTPSGRLPVEIFVRQIRLEGEDLLQWILHDITERRTLDAQRDDLIAMIYHDLRSPLANILYSLDMLETTLGPSADSVKQLIDVANRATDRIQRLTTSLLDIQNLESGQPIQNRRPEPAADILRDSLEAVRPLAESKRQMLEDRIDPGVDLVPVDRDMITRVAINLLENAVKYTPSEGHIQVEVRCDGGFLLFSVEDNGPGIPADQREEIFKKYNRLNRAYIGYGLGLSFCRLAVEGHGGRIWIEEAAGSGARFVFRLPLALEGG